MLNCKTPTYEELCCQLYTYTLTDDTTATLTWNTCTSISRKRPVLLNVFFFFFQPSVL